MVRRSVTTTLARAYQRNLRSIGKATFNAATNVAASASKQVARAAVDALKPPAGRGDWIGGVAIGPAGARRYHLFRPAGTLPFGERLPVMVMLHGCSQDSRGFAAATRMNLLAARSKFLVLYPEQDRLAHPNGCWRWYDADNGKAAAEAATIVAMIDQACLLYGGDARRVAVAGLSAGAGMAACVATRHPGRIRAVVMHSGVGPGAARSSRTAGRAIMGLAMPSAPAVPGAMLPPLMVIHGGSDGIVSFRSGAAAAAVWAVAAGARPASTRVVRRGSRYAMRVTDFRRSGRTVVTLSEIPELGHAWSGGAAKLPFSDPAGPDASRMAWAFAAKQFGQAT